MKKIFLYTAALLTVSLLLTGCNKEDKASTAESFESSNSVSVDESTMEETVTEPESNPIHRELEPAEGTYVYDHAELLTEDELAECNSLAEWLYEKHLINAAVVTTANIEEMSPSEYAENAYIELYGGRGSGLLILINNDTNEDYIYKTGSCLANISQDTQDEALYWATQEIVSGNYKNAVMRLLELGEVCSQHVFDNGGILTAEQISLLEQSCTGGTNDVSVLATSNGTGSTNEEICRSYYDRHYGKTAGYMIMLDTETNTLTVVSDNELSAEAQSAIVSANTLAASGSYTEAITSVIDILKG